MGKDDLRGGTRDVVVQRVSTTVPFNRPTRVDGEAEALGRALADDDLEARRAALAREIARRMGRTIAHPTPSCTAALEMAALLLDIGPGDEVIVPSFAFVTVASAFVQRGATVRFADLDLATARISASEVHRLLTPRTRAVVVIHYAGHVTRLDDIDAALAGRDDVAIVEDCAHSFPFSSRPSARSGRTSRIAVTSFHATKNVNCGEGGALALDDPDLIEKAQVIHDKGTDRARFLANEVARYRWVALGSSYSMSTLLAPPLAVQIDHLDEIHERRRRLWNRYRDELGQFADDRRIRILTPMDPTSSSHIFAVVLPRAQDRPPFLAHLAALGIHATSHYEPLHRSPMGRQLSRDDRPCPDTDRFAASLVRLPLFDSLSEEEQTRVVEGVLSAPSS